MNPIREEPCRVHKGRGDLEVCVGEGDVTLLVEGLPAAIVWPAHLEEGLYDFVRAHDTAAVTDRLPALPLHPDAHLDPDASLQDQLAPLLELLVDGLYQASVISLGPAAPLPPTGDEAVPDPAEARGQYMNWAGLHEVQTRDRLLLGTTPRELLSPDRIDARVRQVQRGGRPLVVLLTAPEAPAAFIVHGHDAMEAYHRTGQSPMAVLLDYQTPRFLSEEEGARVMQTAFARCGEIAAAHYVTMRTARRELERAALVPSPR